MTMEMTTLGGLISLQRGYDLTETQRRVGTVPVVGSAGIHGYHDTARVKGPGVTLGRSGASFGKVTFVRDDFWPHNTTIFVTDFKGNEPLFVRYLLESLDFSSLNSGAAQQSLNRNFVYLVPVRKFELSAQRRIAGLLSAYDDLIENNQRRIQILETVARTLYREWFVGFRFPGHEGVSLVASPLGDIPRGWEVKKLKDVCDLTMGQSPKSEFYNQNGEGQPFHQGVTDFGDRFPADRLFCTAEGRIAEAGDILFSVRAPVGRMNIADKKMILGRGLSAIRHREGYQAFLWEQLRNRFTQDDMMGNGAIFAAVTKSDIQDIDLVCPPSPLIRAAEKHFEPSNGQISALTRQIANLRRTRDLLLPRLLSGQVTPTDTAA